MNIKKLLVGTAVGAIMLGAMIVPAFAAKSSTNNAGAKTYAWHLSADVMPVPPYGSVDEPGSDIASKIIVNQPNGKVVANMTGIMRGLTPGTEYTVYLSNGYTPATFAGWDVSGTYVINVNYLSVDYPETLVLTQSGTSITGVSLNTIPPASLFTITGGSVIGSNITINANLGSLAIQMIGTIAPDGSISGAWADVAPGTRTGTWASTSGTATKNYTGSAGWPGYSTNVPAFTFIANSEGSGNWHINLTGENITLPKDFSVWINSGGGTMLISDSIHLY